MGVNVVTSIWIERPQEVVASFAGDPSAAPKWYQNIKEVRWRTSPPLRIGSRVEFVAEFLGKRLVYTYEVTEYEPATRLVMRTHDGPFPMETTYEWRSSGPGSTEMTLRNRGEPKGFGAIVQPFMSLAMRRANRKDLLKLKQLLEQADPVRERA